MDFCVDLLAPDFTLCPEHFVMHSSTNRRDYVTGFDKSVNGKSGRNTSVTIGGPRNRQVIVYDKRSEIAHSGKTHWWSIWNHERQRRGRSALDPNDPHNSIWRVEFRAGKDLLKDTWGSGHGQTFMSALATFANNLAKSCAIPNQTILTQTGPGGPIICFGKLYVPK